MHAFELGEREQTNTPTAESDYQRTPDFVTAETGQGPINAHTPDFVTEQAGEGPIYGLTPDVVTAVSDYQFTPDVVAARDGGN